MDHSEDKLFPTTRSILSARALLELVQREYNLGELTEGKFLEMGLNDTYIFQSSNEKYIVRVYRVGWRTDNEILAELAVLKHLAEKNFPVSGPFLTRNGESMLKLAAAEGTRQAVVFIFAPGKHPEYSPEHAYLYGKAVAQLHSATADFKSDYPRFALDLNHLLEEPLRAIRPYLAKRPEDSAYLVNLASEIKAGFGPDQLEWGYCHGDLHGWNAHLDENSKLIFFDFDCGGMGWRAYDLAVYRWAIEMHARDQAGALWAEYLRGYAEIRTLSETDLQALPDFVILRSIWLAGLHSAFAAAGNFAWVNDSYFDKFFAFLRQWQANR